MAKKPKAGAPARDAKIEDTAPEDPSASPDLAESGAPQVDPDAERAASEATALPPTADESPVDPAAEAAARKAGADGDAPGDAPGEEPAAQGEGFTMAEGPAEDRGPADDTPDPGDRAVPAPVPALAEDPPRRGGGMSLVLGGIVAALIGAALLWLSETQGWTAFGSDRALTERVDALERELAAARDASQAAEAEIEALKLAEPDLSGVTAANEETRGLADAAGSLAQQTAEALAALAARLDETDARLNEVAVQQIPEAELPRAISDAYDAKLSDLLATIDGRFEDLQAKAAAALAESRADLDARMAEIEAAQEAASAAKAEAEAATLKAQARAAYASIESSLEDGTAFAEPLEELRTLTDVSVPEALSSQAEEGVPTIRELAQAFPAPARQALTEASREAAEAGELTRWQAFKRTHLGARSLSARDGADADAVLSRAESLVSEGRIAEALEELKTLPEAGRAAMAGWVDLAERRLNAVTAAEAIAAELNLNEG